MIKEQIAVRFKQFCRRNNIKEVDGDVVDDFMFHNNLFGEAIYNCLMDIKL